MSQGTSAYANRAFRVNVLVLELLADRDLAMRQINVIRSLLDRLFDLGPVDATQVTRGYTRELFPGNISREDGYDIGIYIEAFGAEYKPARMRIDVAAVLADFFDRQFCIHVTVNHDVSVVLPRTEERRAARAKEFTHL